MWAAFARRHYERLHERYANDVTDDEFALIGPPLPPARRGGRRRTADLREILNLFGCIPRRSWRANGGKPGYPVPWGGVGFIAILYLVLTCYQWLLPRGFPPRSTVYGHIRCFWQEGIWHKIWMMLLMDAREQAGMEASPTAGVADNQSAKTTETGDLFGYNASKKINGRMRHLTTGTLGLPLIFAVDPASIQGRDSLALACR